MGRRVRIQGHLGRHALPLHRLAQKRFGRVGIPFSAQEEVHCLARFIDRSVQVDPFAAHLDVGLIHPPGAAYRASIPPPPLLEFRRVMLYPAQNGRLCQTDAAFAHHADQIPVAQLETQVPPYAQHDNLLVEMATGEQLVDRNKSGHSPSSPIPKSLHQSPLDLFDTARGGVLMGWPQVGTE